MSFSDTVSTFADPVPTFVPTRKPMRQRQHHALRQPKSVSSSSMASTRKPLRQPHALRQPQSSSMASTSSRTQSPLPSTSYASIAATSIPVTRKTVHDSLMCEMCHRKGHLRRSCPRKGIRKKCLDGYSPSFHRTKNEYESLKNLVNTLPFVLIDIPGECGDCQYNVIKSVLEIEDSIDFMRVVARKWVIKKNEQEQYWAPDNVGPKTFEEYINRMLSYSFGDQDTLLGLSEFYRFNYVCLLPDGSVLQTNFPARQKIVFLGLLPIGEHYVALEVSIHSLNS